MKRSRRVIVAALAVAAMLMATAQPVLATPNSTTSNNAGPYITPIGQSDDSRSSFLGRQALLTLGLFQVLCDINVGTAFVGQTHTQATVPNFVMGSGVAGSCTVTGGGSVDGNQIVASANSTTPWYVHVRTHDAFLRSAAGTVNVTTASSFVVTSLATSCQVTVDPQSIDATYTYATTILIVDDSSVAVRVTPIRGMLCPGSGSGRFSTTMNLRPETAAHRLVITDNS